MVCAWVSVTSYYCILNRKFSGKLIEAAHDYKDTQMVPRCSSRKQRRIQGVTKNVYSYFIQILLGFPGKSVDEQDSLCIALIDFLEKPHDYLLP